MSRRPTAATLAEYQQLKAEQTARIGFRDNLMYVTLVAIAGTLTITHSAHSRAYLLLVPPVTCVLGWTYLANDHMISAIGRYIREHPALPGMRWETEHPADRRRRSRKVIQLAVDLAAFTGSALAALTAFWLTPGPPLLILASAAEALATAVLAWQFTAYADLRPAGEPVTGPARRLTIGHRAGDDAVLTGPSTLISGAATSPRNADGPR
ncbi:MAG: hypothetical protein ACRDNF_00915 [Streptosporangiaceae bacterium]